ncbi:MAG: hypothetical protein QNJ97_27245 [Myxococcota bacterium]|nr:hypothetical protein [Myxococcota bacterium]
MKNLAVIIALLMVPLMILIFVHTIRRMIKNAKGEPSPYNRRFSVRVILMVSISIIGLFVYFRISMGSFPESDMIVVEAREYLERTHGHPADKWRIRVVGRLKKFAHEQPRKYYKLAYSYNDTVGRLLVECTHYEAAKELLFNEANEQFDILPPSRESTRDKGLNDLVHSE